MPRSRGPHSRSHRKSVRSTAPASISSTPTRPPSTRSALATARRTLPVSTTNSRAIYDALKGCGIRLVSALPETWLVHLIRMAEEDPDMILVRLAKEEEGVGISAGVHLAGVKSAMLMQNHGFLASINGIVSCAQRYRTPQLMLMRDRVEFRVRDPWQ